LKKPRSIPFEFVLEQLYSLDPIVKPMFGCHAVYVQNKIVLMLRQKEDFPEDNGVWVASTPEHKSKLKAEFPTLRSIGLFGEVTTTWQNLPQRSDSFEEDVMRICELIRKHDLRIGKIPKAKKKKS
jgi:hypothetical protein